MERVNGWIRHRVRRHKEPTVYAHLCADVGHEHFNGIDRTVQDYQAKPTLRSCHFHRFSESEPN